MSPIPQRFDVNQYPISGGCLLFGGLTLLLFRLKDAKCEITTESLQFNLKIVKAGLGLPLGTSSYLWPDLVTFMYDDWDTEVTPTLELRWRDDIYQTFWGGDTKRLHDYLHTFFPEKEKEAPTVRFG